MRIKIVLACTLAVGLVSPAFAASYYVVQHTKTHKCTVARTKPSEKSKTVVLVGDGTAYTSKKEATSAIGTIDACKST
ncbi:MAG TPA: hypothetical protein VH678_10740 [Xanthobacteraceae bacterium]|jgi:hypothetical protein